METRSKKRLRLLNAADQSEPNVNHDDNVPKLTSKTGQKRLHGVEEAAGCSSKRARKVAQLTVKMAGLKRKAEKALRLNLLLPVETLVDLLRLLPRDDLEGSQLVHHKFTRASKAIFKSGDVPPRKIERITVATLKRDSTTGLASAICALAKQSTPDRMVSSVCHWLPCVEWLARVMRFSQVATVDVTAHDSLNLWGIPSEIWHGFMNAFQGAAIDSLRFVRVNFCPLKAAEVDRLTTLNVRTELYVSTCHLLSNQITDAFLLNLSKMGLQKVTLNRCTPVDKATFQAGDDGALALCFPPEQSPQAEHIPLDVNLPQLSLTRQFYEKFLLKCHEAPEDRRVVKCYITPIPVDAERHLMALNPTRRIDDEGDTFLFFQGAGFAFTICRSRVPQTMMCKCG